MKLKFTLLLVLYAFFRISAYSQTYYQGDIDALNAIKQSCDKNNTLNWSDYVPTQYWGGIIWQLDADGIEYRVYALDLSNKSLTGNLDVTNLSYLYSLQCQNNRLTGLSNVFYPNQEINCSGNQLPISELLKFTYMGSDFTYSPQQAVFEEKTEKPGYVIDYSLQADGGNTKFVFRNRSKPGNDGSEIVAVNNTGICPTTEDGVYFCEMVNSKLPNFYSHTANINVSLIPSITLVVEKGDEGNEFDFSIASFSNNTTIGVDFGDGIIVPQTIGSDPINISGILGSSSIVKVYGEGLKSLDCVRKHLIGLDVTNCPTLENLYCANNYISSLNLINNLGLTNLSCEFNNLTKLDISNCFYLFYLDCFNNPLGQLDLTNNSNIYYLNCSSCYLTSLNISNIFTLRSLNVDFNNLVTIDLSSNPHLLNLSCIQNSLTYLDVSNNDALVSLTCDYNKLTTLDISKNMRLNMLSCSGNLLSKLDVQNNDWFYELHCQYNKLPISQLLPIINKSSNFEYCPQSPVFDEATYSTNVTLDYSAQADGGNTTFVFRNRSKPGNDGTEVVAVNNTGIYTTQGNGVYFCEMANPKLNQNNFYSHTANTTINLSGNSSLKSMSVAEASTTSINNESSELIRIYPNPIVDVINAELPNENLPATITLYSIDGKQLKKTETTSAKTTINMEDLKRGNYIIEIKTAKEKIKKKVVKL